jgi:hypothetical protein
MASRPVEGTFALSIFPLSPQTVAETQEPVCIALFSLLNWVIDAPVIGTTRGRPGANQSDAQQQRNSSLFDKLKSGVANNSNGGTQFNSASLDQRSTQLKDLAASDRKNFITVSLEVYHFWPAPATGYV